VKLSYGTLHSQQIAIIFHAIVPTTEFQQGLQNIRNILSLIKNKIHVMNVVICFSRVSYCIMYLSWTNHGE